MTLKYRGVDSTDPKSHQNNEFVKYGKLNQKQNSSLFCHSQAYTNIRNKLVMEIRASCQSVQVMNHADRLKKLLRSQEVYLIKHVMKFICYAHTKRQYILGDAAGKRTPDVPSPSSDTNLNI